MIELYYKGELVLTTVARFEVKYLQVEANVRYWEDSSINGVEDTMGDLIPCREGETWKPLIDVDEGRIANWTTGTIAVIHYKVCDDGIYKLLDDSKEVIKEIDGYVPDLMCPQENGFVDYIIMNVDENGIISKWDPTFDDFIEEE